jgi:hypothetical protein
MASVYVWIECTAAADTWVCVRSNANMKEADLRYVPHVSGQCECAVRFSGMES